MESIVEESQRHSDITPRNALKFSNFYILWIIFALGNQTIPFINTLYKVLNVNYVIKYLKFNYNLKFVQSFEAFWYRFEI